MLFKRKRKVLSTRIDEVSSICETCKFSSQMHATNDLMCSKKGLVSPTSTCRHYAFNHLMKRPPRKRTLKTNNLSPEDFEI